MKNETLQQIIEWENRINVLAGRFPIALKREKKGLTQGIPRQIRSGVPYTLLQMRPDIRQAESQLLATQADILAAKAAFYPSLNISGSFGVEAFLPQLLFTTPGALLYRSMGALAAPLINRSIINAELQQANAAQKEALLNYQKTVVNGYTEVQSLMYRIKYLERNLELKKEQTKVLKNAVETSDILFKAGRSTYIEVLIAQQNALKAKLELIDTRKELYQTTANLYKALGGGWQ
jgi:outer membrane protein TolC